MFKKLLVLLLLFLMASCKNEENNPEYLKPVNDIFIFEELNADVKDKIQTVIGDQQADNYQLKMLDKNIYELNLEDIRGETINLDSLEKVIIQVLSIDCVHCQNQLKIIADLDLNTDTIFVLYFGIGDKNDIADLFEQLSIKLPDNVYVVEENKDFNDYLKYYLQLKFYPTMITYENGKVTFCYAGEYEKEIFDKIYNIAYIDQLKPEDFIDKDGNNVIELSRTIDDLKAELSSDNLNKLKELDNDDYSEQLSLNLMGKKLDFNKLQNSSGSIYIQEVDDYSQYQDKKLVLFYNYLKDENDTAKVEFINELIDNDDSISYVVVLVEGLDSSSQALKKMDIKFNCPVVSVLSKMPEDFFNFGLAAYPTAVFVDRGTFTGAYSNISDVDSFKEAKKLFLSEECIAYKKNN